MEAVIVEMSIKLYAQNKTLALIKKQKLFLVETTQDYQTRIQKIVFENLCFKKRW
jgi:hypothetical protein